MNFLHIFRHFSLPQRHIQPFSIFKTSLMNARNWRAFSSWCAEKGFIIDGSNSRTALNVLNSSKASILFACVSGAVGCAHVHMYADGRVRGPSWLWEFSFIVFCLAGWKRASQLNPELPKMANLTNWASPHLHIPSFKTYRWATTSTQFLPGFWRLELLSWCLYSISPA